MLFSVGRSFHPGRQITKNSKHHCEGNKFLKEIVSNTRLDLQTGSDYFSGFFLAKVLIVLLLLGLFYFKVLKPNNRRPPTPRFRDSGLKRCFFYVFSKEIFFLLLHFIHLYASADFPSKGAIGDPWCFGNFYFLVSICNSNLFCVAGLLECLCGWVCSTSFREGFWFTVFRFYLW